MSWCKADSDIIALKNYVKFPIVLSELYIMYAHAHKKLTRHQLLTHLQCCESVEDSFCFKLQHSKSLTLELSDSIIEKIRTVVYNMDNWFEPSVEHYIFSWLVCHTFLDGWFVTNLYLVK